MFPPYRYAANDICLNILSFNAGDTAVTTKEIPFRYAPHKPIHTERMCRHSTSRRLSEPPYYVLLTFALRILLFSYVLFFILHDFFVMSIKIFI